MRHTTVRSQQDHKFKASVGNLARPCLRIQGGRLQLQAWLVCVYALGPDSLQQTPRAKHSLAQLWTDRDMHSPKARRSCFLLGRGFLRTGSGLCEGRKLWCSNPMGRQWCTGRVALNHQAPKSFSRWSEPEIWDCSGSTGTCLKGERADPCGGLRTDAVTLAAQMAMP